MKVVTRSTHPYDVSYFNCIFVTLRSCTIIDYNVNKDTVLKGDIISGQGLKAKFTDKYGKKIDEDGISHLNQPLRFRLAYRNEELK